MGILAIQELNLSVAVGVLLQANNYSTVTPIACFAEKCTLPTRQFGE